MISQGEIKELEISAQMAMDANESLKDMLGAIAEKHDMVPAVLRKFVMARLKDGRVRLVKETSDMQSLLDFGQCETEGVGRMTRREMASKAAAMLSQ